MSLLASAPTVGIIDDGNNLTLSWTPVTDSSGSYTRYDHWIITIDGTPYRFPSSGVAAFPPTTQTFTQVLNPGDHVITMQAFDNLNAPVTGPWATNAVV